MSKMIGPMMQIGGSAATAMGQPEIGIPMQLGSAAFGGGGAGGGGNPLSALLGNIPAQMMGGGAQRMPQAPAPQTTTGQMQPMNMGSLGGGLGSMGGMGMNPQMMQMLSKIMGMM